MMVTVGWKLVSSGRPNRNLMEIRERKEGEEEKNREISGRGRGKGKKKKKKNVLADEEDEIRGILLKENE